MAAGIWLAVAVMVAVPGCSSLEGDVDQSVYTPADESFEVRLPAGAKRGAVKEAGGGSAGQVGFVGKGERSWQVQRCGKGAHYIARADTELPLATRLLFAEAAWAELTGMVGRPVIGRDVLTMKDGRQAVLAVRRLGINPRSGLRGVLIFETERYVWLLEFSDPALPDASLAEARRQLVELYQGLTVHAG